METLQDLSLEELFGLVDQLVQERPYLQEAAEPDSLESLFEQFDQFTAQRPYLSE